MRDPLADRLIQEPRIRRIVRRTSTVSGAAAVPAVPAPRGEEPDVPAPRSPGPEERTSA
ncbi:hypothetical protein [Actinomycetospora straminea]|uniref:Uncharacterized protein n=1 Tax=Actinomycetospora straminea TaxID=663607 RepID=A0ABP9F8Y6_9PSEU